MRRKYLAGSHVLGHSNLDTTLHHYEQSSMLAAGGSDRCDRANTKKLETATKAGACGSIRHGGPDLT